jgi:hypothetical protein
MKTPGLNKIVLMLSLFFAVSAGMIVQGQTIQAEVPGDNFSLEGALELFKKSTSPEDFERLLNQPESKVNNLDLNGDGNIDYIRVIDRNEGNIHAFIIQAVISENESQDVAVIELEKLADGKAILQITGDADVYGIETIIEPTEEVRVNAGVTTTQAVVNVWAWPSVRYIYGPYYSGWISPWGWEVWPWWWHSWSPVAYHVYYPWWRPYRPYYSVCYSHRIAYGRIYRPYRTTSVIVHNRHHSNIERYRSRRSDHDGHVRGRYDNDRPNGRSINDVNSNGRGDRTNIERNSRSNSDLIRRYQRSDDASSRSSGNMDSYSLPGRSNTGSRNIQQPDRTIRTNASTVPKRSNTSTYEVQRQQPQRTEVQRSQPQRTEVQRPQVQRQQSQRSQVQQPQVQRPQVTRSPAPARKVSAPAPTIKRSSAPSKPAPQKSTPKVKRGKN